MPEPGTFTFLLASLCQGAFLLLLGLAALHDVRDFRIPNRLPALLLAAYCVFALAAPGRTHVLDGLAAGGIALGIGFGLFSVRLMGGGDVKLLAATALWAGLHTMPAHLMAIAVAGAALGLLLVLLRWVVGRAVLFFPGYGPAAPLPRVLRPGEPLPYGVAIAIGSVLVVPL